MNIKKILNCWNQKFNPHKNLLSHFLNKNTFFVGQAGCGKTVILNNLLLFLSRQQKSFLSSGIFPVCPLMADILYESQDIEKSVFFFLYGSRNLSEHHCHSLETKDVLTHDGFLISQALEHFDIRDKQTFLSTWKKLCQNPKWMELVKSCMNQDDFSHSLSFEENKQWQGYLKKTHSFWLGIHNLIHDNILQDNADVGRHNIHKDNLKIFFYCEYGDLSLERKLLHCALSLLYQERKEGVIATDELTYSIMC